ncbi:glycosyl transferase [Bacteroidia bacterium]|nr:glycosyl transferase [Bacteroidia bacterium]
MVKTSVIILNWNGQRFLQKFLPDIVLYTQDDQTQVIIADNGSTDSSVAFLEQHFPQIPLFKFDQNYGFTGGYNRAIELVDSQYVVLLNSDIEVHPDWLQALILHMDSHPQTAACMPKMLSLEHKTQFEYAGAAGGFIDFLGYPFCRGRILATTENDTGQYNTVRDVFWATGACMVVRTSVYKALGGLDNDFFAHMEEIDLCWRMQNAGYKIQCVPTSWVHHVGGGTLPNNHPRKLFFNYRNNLLMLYKNLPNSSLYSLLLLRLLLDGGSALAFLLQGQFSFFMAVVRAHHDFFQLRKGKRQSNTLSFNKLNGVHPRSIIADYFLWGKKRFSQIITE